MQKFICMQIIRTILQLLLRKTSERAIERELKISRPTIHKYKAAFEASSYSHKELLTLSDQALSEIIYPAVSKSKKYLQPEEPSHTDTRLEAFEAKREYFLKELTRQGVTRQLIWEEYLRDHPDGYRYT